jgi:hypothetical protein
MSKQSLFIVGLDPFNLDKLKRLPAAREVDFHAALDVSDIRDVDRYDLPALIDKAVRAIEGFGGSVDGIASYWDFPGSLLVPILAERFGLPGPSLESVVKCEHKYWARLAQQKCIPQHVPIFRAFNPEDDNAFGKLQMMPPFWIKPIKSYRSYLAFQIGDAHQFRSVMEICRAEQSRIVEPFRNLLRELDLPREIVDMPETFIAETPIGGAQCTLEGYVHQGTVTVYGAIDSIRAAGGSSFSRYEYPSSLPLEVQHRMIDAARLAVTAVGLDNCPFNVEFFYDQTAERIWLLEINPRISQAHTDLFEKVAGVSHHGVMVDLALGRKPKPMEHAGRFAIAGHFMVRTRDAGRVTKAPSEETIAALTERQPDSLIRIKVEPGQHLRELQGQDQYSFELAQLYIGARDQLELVDKYHELLEELDFRIKPDSERAVVI